MRSVALGSFLVGLILFQPALAQNGACDFLEEDFSGSGFNIWTAGSGNWVISDGSLLVDQLPTGTLGFYETDFLPWDFFTADVDLEALAWGAASGAGLLVRMSGSDYFQAEGRSVSAVGTVLTENGQVTLLGFDADQEAWFQSSQSVDGGGVTSLGLALSETQATLRINRQNTAVQMSGTFDWFAVDLLRLVAQGTTTQARFDNLCSTTLAEEPPELNYQLTVSKTGTGNGTITSAPAGINCGEDCSENYVAGREVTLTATADVGAVFDGWSGDCEGSVECILTLDADKVVSAGFSLVPVVDNPPTVTITSPANDAVVEGTVSIDVTATDDNAVERVELYVDAAKIGELTTLPYFFQWDSTSVPNGQYTLKATAHDSAGQTTEAQVTIMVDNRYTLTVTHSGLGQGTVTSSPPGIDCGSDCSESFAAGTQVTLTATAAIGSTLANWSGDCSGTGSCLVTMNSNHTISVTFDEVQAVDAPPTVSITSPRDGAWVSGSVEVQVTASDDKGVARVEVFIDGVKLVEENTSTFSYTWDTAKLSDGAHTIEASAYDSSGQAGRSTITLNVGNHSIVALDQPAVFYFPFCQGGGSNFTGFAVSNYSQLPAQLTFRAYNPDGSSAYQQKSFDLQAGRQLALLSNEIFAEPAGSAQSIWVEMTSDNPQVGSFFQFGAENQLDGSVPFTSTHNELHFTRIFDGPEAYRGRAAETWLSIANPADSSVELELSLYPAPEDEAATNMVIEIPPRGFFYGRVNALFPQIEEVVGGFITAVDKEGDGVVAFQLIKLIGASTVIGINAQPVGQTNELYSAQLANLTGFFTNLKVVNPTANDIQVDFSATDEQGNPLTDSVTRSLPAGTALEEDVSVLFGWSPSDLKIGSLELQADRPGLVGDVIFGDATRHKAAAALPLQSGRFSRGVFSQVANISGFYTGVALLNPGPVPAQVTIQVYELGGARNGEKTITLQPGARISKLLTDVDMMPGTAGQVGGYVDIRSDQPLIAQQLFGADALLSAVPPDQVDWSFLVSASLGAEGGTISHSGFSVTIPPGALTSPQILAVYDTNDPLGSAYESMTNRYLITGLPQGFEGSLNLSLPLRATPSGEGVALEVSTPDYVVPTMEPTWSFRWVPAEILGGNLIATANLEPEDSVSNRSRFRAAPKVGSQSVAVGGTISTKGKYSKSGKCWVDGIAKAGYQDEALKACEDFRNFLTRDLGLDWPKSTFGNDKVFSFYWKDLPTFREGETCGYLKRVYLNQNIAKTNCGSHLGTLPCIRATVGHEAFHLWRNYITGPRATHSWLEESTCVWFESLMLPNDCSSELKGNANYFPRAGLFKPSKSAAKTQGATKAEQAHGYGAAAFLHFLQKEYPAKGRKLVGDLWKSIVADPYVSWYSHFHNATGDPGWASKWGKYIEEWYTAQFSPPGCMKEFPFKSRTNVAELTWRWGPTEEWASGKKSIQASLPPLSGDFFKVNIQKAADGLLRPYTNPRLKIVASGFTGGLQKAKLFFLDASLKVTEIASLNTGSTSLIVPDLKSKLPEIQGRDSYFVLTYHNEGLSSSTEIKLDLEVMVGPVLTHCDIEVDAIELEYRNRDTGVTFFSQWGTLYVPALGWEYEGEISGSQFSSNKPICRGSPCAQGNYSGHSEITFGASDLASITSLEAVSEGDQSKEKTILKLSDLPRTHHDPGSVVLNWYQASGDDVCRRLDEMAYQDSTSQEPTGKFRCTSSTKLAVRCSTSDP